MNFATLLVLIPIVIGLIFAIRYVVRNGACGGCPGSKHCHAKGQQSSCGGSCSSCRSCSMDTDIKPAANRHG